MSLTTLVKTFVASDVVERAVKTFVQAFIAVVVLSSNPVSKSALVAGLAAGISAVWNFVRNTA